MAKAKQPTNMAEKGIQQKETGRRDAYIEEYIATRMAGSSPEKAATAAREASGMSDYSATGNSAADRALAAGDAYLDEDTGRVMLTEEGRQRVGNRTYTQAEKEGFRELSPAEKYAERVKQTQATVTEDMPHSGWDIQINPIGTHDGYTDPAAAYAARAARTQAENAGGPSAIERAIEYAKGAADRVSFPDFTKQAGEPTMVWNSEPNGATAGGDGAKPGLENQAGKESGTGAAGGTAATHGIKNPITGKTVVRITAPIMEPDRPEITSSPQYIYPEDNTGKMRFQSRSPFEDWEKELIDEMNVAYENQNVKEQNRLRDIYNGGYDSYQRYQYEKTLPTGADPYGGMLEALSNDDKEAYDSAQDELRAHGYSQDMIDEQAAEAIRRSDKSKKAKELELQDYLGLSPSDAEATTILWWWQDSNGKAAADADKNGKLKQDELGAYLQGLEQNKTLSEAQAAAIWKESFPTAKKDYSTWKTTGVNNPIIAAADTDKNGRLKQAELGAYLIQQQDDGMTDEEAARIWAEMFPTAKTSYETWRGKQK